MCQLEAVAWHGVLEALASRMCNSDGLRCLVTWSRCSVAVVGPGGAAVVLKWRGAQELNKMVLVMVHLGAQLYRLDPECGKEACGCFGRVIVQRCGTMGTVHVILFSFNTLFGLPEQELRCQLSISSGCKGCATCRSLVVLYSFPPLIVE